MNYESEAKKSGQRKLVSRFSWILENRREFLKTVRVVGAVLVIAAVSVVTQLIFMDTVKEFRSVADLNKNIEWKIIGKYVDKGTDRTDYYVKVEKGKYYTNKRLDKVDYDSFNVGDTLITEATDHELQSIGGYKVTCFMLLFTMCIMALPVFIIPGLLDLNIETSTYLFLRRVEEHNLMFNKEVDKLWITDKFVKYEDYLQLGILGVVLCVSAFEIWCVYYLTLCL